MLVSGINSNTNINPADNEQPKFRQIRDNFQLLEQALQSGNLSGAQQAFAALQQLMPDLSVGNKIQNGQISRSQGAFRTDFNAIGQALKSGNISEAKAAFAKFQQDVPLINKGRHSLNRYSNVAGSKNSIPNSSGSLSLINTHNINYQSVGSKINITA